MLFLEPPPFCVEGGQRILFPGEPCFPGNCDLETYIYSGFSLTVASAFKCNCVVKWLPSLHICIMPVNFSQFLYLC
jgi:hypothetical protein